MMAMMMFVSEGWPRQVYRSRGAWRRVCWARCPTPCEASWGDTNSWLLPQPPLTSAQDAAARQVSLRITGLCEYLKPWVSISLITQYFSFFIGNIFSFSTVRFFYMHSHQSFLFLGFESLQRWRLWVSAESLQLHGLPGGGVWPEQTPSVCWWLSGEFWSEGAAAAQGLTSMMSQSVAVILLSLVRGGVWWALWLWAGKASPFQQFFSALHLFVVRPCWLQFMSTGNGSDDNDYNASNGC